MKEMTKKELLLISHLLEIASDEFGNHGCNDFKLSDFFSEEECVKFDKEYHEWNGDPDEHDSQYARSGWFQDYAVMSYYSHKLKKLGTYEN